MPSPRKDKTTPHPIDWEKYQHLFRETAVPAGGNGSTYSPVTSRFSASPPLYESLLHQLPYLALDCL
ncbi:hypothetical protein Q4E93_25355 [Flavitalea sp. BT771]|nr:hypothetical protein [Flavitalea sp. BT771]